MSKDQYFRLSFTPLAPLHLGTGSDYEPTNYVIDDGVLFEFDGLGVQATISENGRQELMRILAGRPNSEMLRAVQGFFYKHRERLIGVSRNQVRVPPAVEAFYQERIGQVAQQEQGGRQVLNKLEIQRTAWTPGGAPILPGSAVKGAIRTALLDKVNGGRRQNEQRERNRDLQYRLFGYGAGRFHLDPMRLIRIGDAAATAQDAATEVRFAVNRKKQPVERHGTLVQSQAEQQGLHQLLECIPPFTQRAYTADLAVQELGGLEVPSDKTPQKTFDAEDICTACNAFYIHHFERELKLLRGRGFVDQRWGEQAEETLSAVAPAMQANRAFLLRVGRHCGAESVTLRGLPRQIRIMQGRGAKPAFEEESKTVWLAAEERQAQRGLLPFGWVLVEIRPVNADQPPWPGPGIDTKMNGDWRAMARARVAMARQELDEEQRRDKERATQIAAEEEAARERERAEQERLEAATAGLPEDAAHIERQRYKDAWQTNDQFLQDAEALFESTEALSGEAYDQLVEEMTKRWPGIMTDPDAVKGKKNKPKFNQRPRELAKRLRTINTAT